MSNFWTILFLCVASGAAGLVIGIVVGVKVRDGMPNYMKWKW